MTQKSPGKSWNLILQFLWQPCRSKIKLLLKKKLQNFRMLGALPPTPNGFRRLGVAPIPKTTTLSLQIFGFAPG